MTLAILLLSWILIHFYFDTSGATVKYSKPPSPQTSSLNEACGRSQIFFRGKYIDTCVQIKGKQPKCSIVDSGRGVRWMYCEETVESKLEMLFNALNTYDLEIKALRTLLKKTISTMEKLQIKVTKLSSNFPISTTPILLPLKFTEVCQQRSGRNYLFVSLQKNYDDAEAYCIERGGNLAMPEDLSANQFLGLTAKTMSLAGASVEKHSGFFKMFWWIGVNDRNVESQFQFINGTGFNYPRPFVNGQPGGRNKQVEEDCVQLGLSFENFELWNDAPCQWLANFICQIDTKRYCK